MHRKKRDWGRLLGIALNPPMHDSVLIIYMTTVAKLGKKAADETNEKLYGQSCFRLRGNQALNSKALKFSMTRKSLVNLILSFSG